jgi:hypothetical protein
VPRGRPKGAKDLKPRKGAKAKPAETPVVDVVKEEPQDLGSFALSILSDPATREGIRTRAKEGTLTAQEMRALLQWATTAPQEVKRPSQWKTMSEAADPIETQMIANIARRAMGKPEMPIYLQGQTEAWTNAEIIAGKRETRPEPGDARALPAHRARRAVRCPRADPR